MTTTGVSFVESESQLVKQKLDALNKAFELINVLGAERRKYLEERRDYHKYMTYFKITIISWGFCKQ